MKESELAEQVISWLESQRWDVYQEVQIHTQGKVADIVAKSGKIMWMIKTKMSLSMAVIEQAWKWKEAAHYVSVAVPWTTSATKGRSFAHRVLKDFGIGLITVRERIEIQSRGAQLRRRLIFGEELFSALIPARKTFAKAGNSNGLRWTPYAQTCSAVAKIVKEHPCGIAVSTVIKKLAGGHHYSTDQSCRSSLIKWASEGGVRGVALKREGKQMLFVPNP